MSSYKKYGILIMVVVVVSLLFSCQKEFLKKPIGSDLNVDSIFAGRQKALGAIAQAYAMSLSSGITIVDWDHNRVNGMRAGTLSHISGELSVVKFNWEDGWIIQRSGMTADDGSGIPRSSDGLVFNYRCIRHNRLVMDNIDKVPDMSEMEKLQVKAEMKVLTAYRYEEMLKRYGGVPIVDSVFGVNDEISIQRSTVDETVNYILSLCDEASSNLPDSHPPDMLGRVHKGVALAIKAETLMFAARPLFNNATPYLSLQDNNAFICYGNFDAARWEKAAEASKAVIDWCAANGIVIINTGNPLADYGTAVATPSNKEIILGYKDQQASDAGNGNYYSARSQGGGANSMSFYQLQQYRKADGTDQTWPAQNEQTPYSDYAERIQEMEPRYKASAIGAGMDAWNNPNDNNWSSSVIVDGSTWGGRGGTEGCGKRCKFYYKAGNRRWFEFPIYRLAEFYLNAAEAYNEMGQTQTSLQHLNVIRNRAGQPDETAGDKDKLRSIIQREWAVEFYEEGHRLFDVKHWKLSDIGNGIIGGPRKSFVFTYKSGDFGRVAADYVSYAVTEVYRAYWAANQYLEPFPITEVNKGYLIQNPGY